MIRRSHRDNSKATARSTRVREKAIQMRNRMQASVRHFMARHAERRSWWHRTFRAPVVAFNWIFTQAKTWVSALLTLLGLGTPANVRQTTAKGTSLPLSRRRRHSLTRGNRLAFEGLESRRLLALDILDATITPLETATGTVHTVFVNQGNATTFTITSGNTNNAFSINNAGVISVSGNLDYEVTQLYSLTISASGSGTDSATITINVTDEAPAIVAQTFSVSENAEEDDVVGSVDLASGSDDDSVEFSITGGTGATFFAIDEITGEITVTAAGAAAFDTEATPSYTLEVTLTDGTTPSVAIMTINVTDEAPAIVAGGPFNVNENVDNGTVVGQVNLTSMSDNDSVTFAIASGDPEGVFQIDPGTGVITVADTSKLDFETVQSYTLHVVASDGTSSDTKTFIVEVVNSNESAHIQVTGSVLLVSDPDGTTASDISLSIVSGMLRFTDSQSELGARTGSLRVSSNTVDVSPLGISSIVFQLGSATDALTISSVIDAFITSATGELDQVTITSTGKLRLNGDLRAAISSAAGSVIETTGHATIGDGSVTGASIAGDLFVNFGHTLTIDDSDEAEISGDAVVNGTLASSVDVSSTGSLTGMGTINGDVSGDGFFSPDMIMTINGDFAPTGVVEFLVNRTYATPGSDYDQYVVNGNVDLSGATLDFVQVTGGSVAILPSMVLIKNDSTDAVIASGASPAQGETFAFGGIFYQLNYSGGIDGNDVVLNQVGGVSYDEDSDELTVYGSNGADNIRIEELEPGFVSVRGSFGDVGSTRITIGTALDPISKITVLLYDGNNNADVRVSMPTIIIGGNGDDTIRRSNGVGILVGGGGTDVLRGQNASVILIGGDGTDRLNGSSERDILIGGDTANAFDLAYLSLALAELEDNDIAGALSQLGSVSDDLDIDRLIGGAGLDEVLGGAGDIALQ